MEKGLYQQIGKKAVAQAMRLQKAFLDKGYPLLISSPTNQQFPILPDAHLDELSKNYTSCWWCKPDEGHTAVRFCVSWSTTDEEIDRLIADIQAL